MNFATDIAVTESVEEKANRYFAEQCRRLGPLTIVGRAPRPAGRLQPAATKPSSSRARARERA